LGAAARARSRSGWNSRSVVPTRILILLAVSAAAAGQTKVAVISHRGEHLHHPENTLAAYRAAFEAGADFIETDVRTTADGKLVIMHDATVDRCTTGHGQVASLSFAEISKLGVATFDQVLAFARGRIGVYIDAKKISAQNLVDAVRRHGMRDRVVVYGGIELLRAVAKLDGRLKVMPEAASVNVVERVMDELRPRVVAFDARDFTDEILAIVTRARAGVYVDRLGMLDNKEGWENAVRRGATGIQSDHPAELVAFLRAKGLHR
jgi:glycerophosphoryl diester phosphodiesterase